MHYQFLDGGRNPLTSLLRDRKEYLVDQPHESHDRVEFQLIVEVGLQVEEDSFAIRPLSDFFPDFFLGNEASGWSDNGVLQRIVFLRRYIVAQQSDSFLKFQQAPRRTREPAVSSAAMSARKRCVLADFSPICPVPYRLLAGQPAAADSGGRAATDPPAPLRPPRQSAAP